MRRQWSFPRVLTLEVLSSCPGYGLVPPCHRFFIPSPDFLLNVEHDTHLPVPLSQTKGSASTVKAPAGRCLKTILNVLLSQREGCKVAWKG